MHQMGKGKQDYFKRSTISLVFLGPPALPHRNYCMAIPTANLSPAFKRSCYTKALFDLPVLRLP